MKKFIEQLVVYLVIFGVLIVMYYVSGFEKTVITAFALIIGNLFTNEK